MKKETASDSTYHVRHSARSLRRAKCVAEHIEPGATVLDVGCNNGITSQYLIDKSIATHVTGVELLATTVSESLKQDSRFTLIEGNIAELEIKKRFDACIYGAVHHHILNFYGLSAAVATLQMLAEQCDRYLFFETGQISEGGRWSWQSAIRQNFRTDEEHFFYLLRSIEHLIDDFSIIGKFWIHGARRWYLRLDMKSEAGRASAMSPVVVRSLPEIIDGPYVRSRGSKNQILSRTDDVKNSQSPTVFSIATEPDGSRSFVKTYLHHPSAAAVEYQIGQEITESWAVKATALTDTTGMLVFPYIDKARSVRSFSTAARSTRQLIAHQVLRIFDDARQTAITLPRRLLLPTKAGLTLVDVCDLNQNNFLITDGDQRYTIRVIDFEQQSADYSYRNRLHLARLLWILRQNRLRAMTEFLLGLAGGLINMLKYQTKSAATRIRDRQPSLTSLIVADLQTIGGGVLRVMLKTIGFS